MMTVREGNAAVQAALDRYLAASLIQELVAERQAARKRKDFKKADEIRAELAARGIALMDTPQGVKWERRAVAVKAATAEAARASAEEAAVAARAEKEAEEAEAEEEAEAAE